MIFLIMVKKSLLLYLCSLLVQEALPFQTDAANYCVSCCTTVGTSCTINQSNGVREHYGRPTCNILFASSHDVSAVVGVINKLCHHKFYRQHDRLALAKFSKSRVWDEVPEGSTSYFGDTRITL